MAARTAAITFIDRKRRCRSMTDTTHPGGDRRGRKRTGRHRCPGREYQTPHPRVERSEWFRRYWIAVVARRTPASRDLLLDEADDEALISSREGGILVLLQGCRNRGRPSSRSNAVRQSASSAVPRGSRPRRSLSGQAPTTSTTSARGVRPRPGPARTWRGSCSSAGPPPRAQTGSATSSRIPASLRELRVPHTVTYGSTRTGKFIGENYSEVPCPGINPSQQLTPYTSAETTRQRPVAGAGWSGRGRREEALEGGLGQAGACAG